MSPPLAISAATLSPAGLVLSSATSVKAGLPAALSTGASLTAVTVSVNVCTALVSTPPLAVPPLSWIWTETVALPFASAAGVYVSVPLAAIAGWLENRPLLLFDTMKSTTWVDSLAGPLLIAVAQPTTVCAPPSSFTVCRRPW